MCRCTPEMRTPWCGKPGCEMPPQGARPFKQYRRKQIAELRSVEPFEDLTGVSISAEDLKAGSPKMGDMVARNPKNHADQWLVAKQYFHDNFEAAE